MPVVVVKVAKFIVVLLLPILSGCISFPPTDGFIRRGPNYEKLAPEIRRIGIVTDVLLTHKSFRTNSLSIPDSLALGNHIMAATAQCLTNKGYEVVFSDGPLVGAVPVEERPMRWALEWRLLDAPSSIPEQIPPALADDAPYRDALVKVTRRAFAAVAESAELPTDTFRAAPTLQASLDLIAQRKGVQYLVVVVGDAVVVSPGLQVGQTVSTFAISTLFNTGTGDFSQSSQMLSYVCVVNLTDGEVVWTNVGDIPRNPMKSLSLEKTCANWATKQFYHFPSRVTELAPAPTKTRR
ncbi:MAG: hypothetical protein AB1705_28000 [Verrucomicrobiota bacterium]